METQNAAEVLRQVPLFRTLGKAQVDRLAARTSRREFPAGTRILQHGDTAVSLYVVCRGGVRVFDTPQPAEVDAETEVQGPGTVFGELALIDDGPRAVTVVTSEPTECLLLSRWDFEGELGQDPDLARTLLPGLCARIRRLEERLARYERVGTGD